MGYHLRVQESFRFQSFSNDFYTLVPIVHLLPRQILIYHFTIYWDLDDSMQQMYFYSKTIQFQTFSYFLVFDKEHLVSAFLLSSNSSWFECPILVPISNIRFSEFNIFILTIVAVPDPPFYFLPAITKVLFMNLFLLYPNSGIVS